MSNMSVTDILKIHGKWIQSKEFVLLVAQKMRISERQAYRLIEKDKDLIRIPLTHRNVIYGLAQFGQPHQDTIPKIKEQKNEPKFNDDEITGLASLLLATSPYLRNRARLEIWLRRGAKPEEWPELEK